MNVKHGRERLRDHIVKSAAMLLLLLTFVGISGGSQIVTAQSSPEQQLVDKYAPIAMLKSHPSQCSDEGEPYFPSTVDFLFDNPDVMLRANGDGDQKDDPILKTGLTPQDLVNAGPDTYLDLPGQPRDPGCDYEKYFDQKVEEFGLEPTTYAKITIDDAARKLYIEYWFYYYFNDWNDTHESDWEMIFVEFDGVLSAEEALEVEPAGVAYAQHGGGELSNWDDEKLQKDGDKPIVYPSAGSHATYYGQHTFIGWGENGTAFGCDDTTAPSTETPLKAVLVPDDIDPDGEFAFFLYQGRWGQRDFTVYNGPKGANMGGKWTDPTGAIENWRFSTLKVPESSAGGVSTTDAFCRLSEVGSNVFTYFGSHPKSTLFGLLVFFGVLGFFIYKIWAYFMEAIDIYGNELLTFMGIGSLAVPIGLLGGLTAGYLSNAPPLEWINEAFNDSPGGKLAASLTVGSVQQILMVLLIVPACVYAMKDIRNGIIPGVWRSYKGAIKAIPVTVPAILVIAVILSFSLVSVVFVPIVLYIIVRWQFFLEAAIIDEHKPFNRALEQSWSITKRHWFKAFLGSLVFQFLAVVPGPLIGVLVLIVGGSRVSFANFLSSFIYALTIPLATVGITMLYHRLSGHEIVEPKIVTHPIEDVESGKTSGTVAGGTARA